MINLIKIELRKIRKTRYFLGSFLSMGLAVIISLLFMLINPDGFVIGDLNKINIMLISIVWTKTIFPLISMSQILMGRGVDGIKSNMMTPINRYKIIALKILGSLTWLLMLLMASILMVTLLELLIFKEIEIINIVLKSLQQYVLIVIYTLPLQIVAMFLTLLLHNIIIPMLLFIGTMIAGYIIQLYGQVSYLPSVLPKYIGNNIPFDVQAYVAFGIMMLFGFVALLLLVYFIKNKEYVK